MDSRCNSDDRVETAPLLADHDHDFDIDDPIENEPTLPYPCPSSSGSKQQPTIFNLLTRFQARRPRTVVYLLSLLLFTIITSAILVLMPILRLIEDMACHTFYGKPPSEPIDEHLCKVDEVQGPLAYFGGISALLGAIVSLVAALPYGVLADRVGRKPAFVLAYVGVLMAFAWAPLMLKVVRTENLYVLMVGSVFFLVGGGIPTALNSLNAMAADVSSEAEK